MVQSFYPINGVVLHYRVMYGAEQTLVMRDEGTDGDTTAGDGIYTAVIPAGAYGSGEMVRWYVTTADTLGFQWRAPLFRDPTFSPEYFGTVVVNPTINTALPVFHRFIQYANLAETWTGTRASVFYLDQFYDNVYVRIRGDTAQWWPKKSYKFDFNRGHHFRFDPDQPRVEEINVNTTYTDKSYIRTFLAYDTFRD
ncbi:hypothetical protein LCGC14_2835670, partial [marine sediment metagenome]